MIKNNLLANDSLRIIGIVGTAKNTGKTTTLSFLIQDAFSKRYSIGVTGIGYDGEEIDTITMLPKPRLLLEKNTIAATSEDCLKVTTADYKLLETTNIVTPLGKVCIVKIIEPGLMVIAGPNKKFELARVIKKLKKYDLDIIFIDGSLNRIAPLARVDKIIFTTGASRNTDIDFLAKEMKEIGLIFQQEKTKFNGLDQNRIQIISEQIREIDLVSLLDEDDANLVAQKCDNNTRAFFVPGMVSLKGLKKFLVAIKNKSSLELILDSPITMMLSGEPSEAAAFIKTATAHNLKITYCYKPELTAVTINPFYPLERNFHFNTAYVDKEFLFIQVRNALAVPVFNIKEGSVNLLELCIN
ncbi:MAG: hypothetical protein JW866_06360 [Ignavibacteriales bacterium]|nr:hypothetical protein [Ignavibacteriales bacterium]